MTAMLERFNDKCLPVTESGCWLWIGALFESGYGKLDSRDGRKLRAHRMSWELFVGPIPAGAHVLHKCDVRCCVNPAHLFLGNHLDNVIDMVSKGRQRNGGKARRRPFTDEEVLAIRSDTRPARVLARHYGTYSGTISKLRLGQRRSWLR